MKRILFFRHKLISLASLILSLIVKIGAQTNTSRGFERGLAETSESNFWWYALVLLLAIGFSAIAIWRFRVSKVSGPGLPGRSAQRFDKSGKPASLNAAKGKYPRNLPQAGEFLNKSSSGRMADGRPEAERAPEKTPYFQLPISLFDELKPAAPYAELPVSDDGDLLNAIEQVQEESDEDEEFRGLAVRILAAFKTRNSVESLAPVALYDLSSNLRSEAVSTLADFDHESVFETLLLANADPTREVRAAAARALFRLSFERADAWTRIAASGERYQIRQMARAATEADLVSRSFDRLVYEDRQIAYEAFALIRMMLKAGEADEVFDALLNHPDENVRKALMHVIKIAREPKTLEKLQVLEGNDNLPGELRREVEETIRQINSVTV